jgi:CBS domain containing-hemolysin-like protein
MLSLAMVAFFAGSETAVVSASLARIEILAQQSDRRARFIKRLMQEPDRMLGTVLAGTNLMTAAAGVAGMRLTRFILPGQGGIQELFNTLVMTSVILVFGEILPKSVFRAKADSLALRSAPILRLAELVLRPVVVLTSKFSQLIVRYTGEESREERARIIREELKLLAEMGQEEGALKKAQFRMIQGILDLDERTVGKAMTPLIDMVALPVSTDTDTFLAKASETGFSRIPVYTERIDDIVGVVNVLDVLFAETASPTLEPFIRRDIRHEPESRRVFPLLRELSRSRRPMVFVVDEYGGVVGLVTVEDLVEEVMGDIWDEKDREEMEAVQRISDRVLDCDGKTEIQLLNHDYGLSIPEGEYNTIAGFVIERLQRIPKKGESFTHEGLKFLVLDADAKSVRRVRILKTKQ